MANQEGFTFSNTDDVTGDRLNTTIRDAVIDLANNVSGELGTANIADGAITADKIAVGAVKGIAGHLNGLDIDNNATLPLKDLDIAVGEATDEAGNVVGTIATVIGKKSNVTWADGGTAATPTGGLADSLTFTASTSYTAHLLIKADGTANVGFDTQVDASEILADLAVIAAGYLSARRIGSVWIDAGSDVMPRKQVGDRVDIDSIDAEYESAIADPTASTLTPVTFPGLPEGIEVEAILVGGITKVSGAGADFMLANWYHPDSANTEATVERRWSINYEDSVGSTSDAFVGRVLTNTSRQASYIVERTSTGFTFSFAISGYIDTRGK